MNRLRAGLAVGNVPDLIFDEFLSPMARSRSRQFWTPIGVAQRAALRLAERGARRVLDVGSGPGKFGIVAACARPEVQFRGVEHRAALVESAGALAQRLRIENLEFSRGDALAVDWHGFDGFYFFNPFAENSFASEDVFDATVELSARRLTSELLRSTQLLSSVRVGTVVVTYHGLSGPIPSSFDLDFEERVGATLLRTWVKTRCCQEGWYHLEEGDRVSRVQQSYWERRLAAPNVRPNS